MCEVRSMEIYKNIAFFLVEIIKYEGIWQP